MQGISCPNPKCENAGRENTGGKPEGDPQLWRDGEAKATRLQTACGQENFKRWEIHPHPTNKGP